MESHKSHANPESVDDSTGVCTPGSISRVKCNFCICSDGGVLGEQACTKNNCFENIKITNEKFVCEPLDYYEVDCNICLCPPNGLKNVAKCTKNSCEKSALRSDSCIPGHLFSDDCNVCVCPPNGNKADRVCTNNTCSGSRWRISKSSISLLENQVHDDATRNLDVCFPGEEFSMGCNICLCPDLGLKVYASCERIICNEKEKGITKPTAGGFDLDRSSKLDMSTIKAIKHLNAHSRIRRDVHDKCYIYHLSDSAERKECSPGSMYILREVNANGINDNNIDIQKILKVNVRLMPRCNICFCLANALAETVWSERCARNSVVLNDCNWCRCNERQKYDCKARVCEEIDTFGHFKDAIQEIDVGMEGHGSWRSKPSACTSGVHYRRGSILCVCDEDGNWPNPVCRDLFQILHEVELTGQTRLAQNESCTPTKLYLVGCNVCYCPSSGYLDPEMCTKKECQEDDPVLETNESFQMTNPKNNEDDVDNIQEIYATCDLKNQYVLGCRNCECLQNNRLLCGNCTNPKKQYLNPMNKRSKSFNFKKPGSQNKLYKPLQNVCHNKKPLKVFRVGCNLCHCGKTKAKRMFCTLKKCIKRTEKLQVLFPHDDSSEDNLKEVSAPPDDQSCVPRTKYNRDCNVCKCYEVANNVKRIKCTRNKCKSASNIGEHPKVIEDQRKDCVPGTYYQETCMLCHCFVRDGVKYEMCRFNEECVNEENRKKKTLQGKIMKDVKTLLGFCEPMRRYKNECNTCRCLADGKTVECSSKICSLRSNDLSVDIVPVVVENDEACPKGHSYKLDCNVCFCLSNGNAICTTNNCSNN
ncbi:uncharacterized protein LOC112055755 [Bicyclus anynana]|uniref:Uncharacterized protein LOC112055755 n=1 Tax=Bicyclus anynana TaxID=110368 RepID=A0A6J1P1F0_BICAN|nr:uncharacterized protein LOC112055755 [Bicyclus anynana]